MKCQISGDGTGPGRSSKTDNRIGESQWRTKKEFLRYRNY